MKFVFAVAIGFAACAPRTSSNAAWDLHTERDRPATERVPQPASGSTKGLREGSISRTALVGFLDAGPAKALGALELEAVTDGQTFKGWRVIRIVQPASPIAQADIQANDVIHTINQMAISKPDEFMRAWDALKTAAAIDIQMTRNNAAWPLRFVVTEP